MDTVISVSVSSPNRTIRSPTEDVLPYAILLPQTNIYSGPTTWKEVYFSIVSPDLLLFPF